MTYLFSPDNWEWLWSGNNARFILEGFAINLEIAAVGMLLSLIVALPLALMGISKRRPVRVATRLWVDFWRNLPLLLVILYFALVMPTSLREGYESVAPGFFPEALQQGRVLAGLTALVLYNSAVIAEIMRAGILSLDRGQEQAAAALGLSYTQQMRFVVLPQGLRRMVPATVSQLITLNKDTTLVSIIAIQEVLAKGSVVYGFNFFGGTQAPILHVLIFIGLLFLIVNYGLSRLSRRLELPGEEGAARVSGVEDQVAPAPAR